MGRTNATYRDVLRSIQDDWTPFRRALRQEDEEHFRHLLDHARRYADAGGNLNPLEPVPIVLLSMLLAQERERAELADRVDELEARLEGLEE